MRTRRSMRTPPYNYEAEMKRPMCKGCTKASGTLVHYCTMYNRTPPVMFIEADECPHNYRRKRLGGKVRVGQGKGRSGGNL